MPWLWEGHLQYQLPWIWDQLPLDLGSASLALETTSLIVRATSIPLAFSRGLTSLPLPLPLSSGRGPSWLAPVPLAASTSWPWSLALTGLLETSGGGREVWVVEGYSKEVRARAARGRSTAGTLWMSLGQKMFSAFLHSEVAGTPTQLSAFPHTSLQQSLQTSVSSSVSWISVSCTPRSQDTCSKASIASLAFCSSAFNSRTCCFSMASFILV